MNVSTAVLVWLMEFVPALMASVDQLVKFQHVGKHVKMAELALESTLVFVVVVFVQFLC